MGSNMRDHQQRLASQGKNVVLVGGHYGNWVALARCCLDLQLISKPIALFTLYE